MAPDKAFQQAPVTARNDLTALACRDVAEIFLLVTRVNAALVVVTGLKRGL